MAEFDLVDIVRLPGLRLVSAGIVPQEDRGSDQKEQQLKVQLFFCGRRVEKSGDKILDYHQVQNFYSLIGEKILIKFKLGEEVFQRCLELGLKPGSQCDWDAVPQVWFFKDKSGASKNGIWYKPAALLKLDGKETHYHILKAANRPAMQDAFAYFNKSNNTHEANGWDSALGNLEQEINSELQGVS